MFISSHTILTFTSLQNGNVRANMCEYICQQSTLAGGVERTLSEFSCESFLYLSSYLDLSGRVYSSEELTQTVRGSRRGYDLRRGATACSVSLDWIDGSSILLFTSVNV